jgi:branched-chain amino acid transport system ATP-binding protein
MSVPAAATSSHPVSAADGPPLLELRSVEAGYGRGAVLSDLTLEVPAGGIVCLLGANGAGKSTTLRVASGLLSPSRGEVRLAGRRIDGRPAEQIVGLGLAHVPEGRQIFPGLTIEENLRVGAFAARRDDRKANLERVHHHFPILAERRGQLAGTLSGGEQQQLAIGRALMGRPRLLMLDEPSLGLSPAMVRTIFRIIAEIHAEGTAVLLVEQNAHLALQVASFGYVLETGRLALAGPTTTLRDNPSVRRSYLGG